MPPYAGEQDSTAALDIANDPFVDIRQPDKTEDAPPAMMAPTPSEDSQAEEESPSTSICDIFNPCSGGASSSSAADAPADAAVGGGFPNPLPSHVFKTRKCAECGCKISKFSGYVKEVVPNGTPDDALFDEDESVGGGGEQPAKKCHKIYYRKGCYKIKQFRDEHKKTFPAVLEQLLDHFAEIARLKAAEEEALRRIKAEEEEQERQRALDEEEKAQKEGDGKKSKLKSLKKSFSKKSFKKGFSSLKLRKSKKKRLAADDGGEKSVDGKWKRYYDASHERYYYSDGATTTWTEPAAFKAAPTPDVESDADSTQ